MTVVQKISQQIRRIADDSTFGYEHLDLTKDEYQTAAKALERLQKKGVIKKLSKGTFYKPRTTVFGEALPSTEAIITPYLFEGNKRIAYITGTYLYNQLGLTTQQAFHLKIASRTKRIYINTRTLKASPVKSYAEVTADNYQLLGFLDAIKDLKQIPDSTPKNSIHILNSVIQKMTDAQRQAVIRYALVYPPRVRAVVGALLEQTGNVTGIEKLHKSLNPLTTYQLGITTKDLPNATAWNIV